MNRPLMLAIADDERDTREYLQEVLPRLGHEVVAVAQTGRQLVEICRGRTVDLVITDIRMPDMDGIEAAVSINKDRQIPVLLVSAHHDGDLLARASADHIMGYLIKPIREADLKTAIAIAMLRFQHFQTLYKESADLRQALEDRKLIERAKGIIIKRLRLDEEEAFRRLRKLSSNENRKLAETAHRILEADEVFQQMDRL
jgi:response regulator NasT